MKESFYINLMKLFMFELYKMSDELENKKPSGYFGTK